MQINVNPNLTVGERKGILSLLRQYSDCFGWDKTNIGKTEACELVINLTDGTPVCQPPYRVSHRERHLIRAQVEEMSHNSVIRPSKSLYASPVVLVKKKTGDWRFCVDYRKLNSKLVDDKYPLPLIDDILTYLNGCGWFCSLDMNTGYWQIPIAEEDKHKTAFITPDGLWEFNVTPFGLKTYPAVIQRCMDQVLAGLQWGSCLVYLDNLLVMAPDCETMLKRVQDVLERLRCSSLTLNPCKCTFGYSQVTILGYTVDSVTINNYNWTV